MRDGARRAIYRADGLSVPVPIVMEGDSILGTTIDYFNGFEMSPNGSLVFDARLNDGRYGPLRYSNDGTFSILDVPYFYRSHAINDRGEVVFTGDADDVFGFHLWNGSTSTPLLSWGDPVGNTTAGSFLDATITASGTVYGLIGTPDNSYVVIDTSNRNVLFQDGDRFNGTATTYFARFVPGAGVGPPQVFAGEDQASVFEATATGLSPVWVRSELPKSHPAGGSSNMNGAVRNPRGDVYIAAGRGIFRHDGTLETLVEYPYTYTEGTSEVELHWTDTWWNGSNNMAANDAGTLVWRAGTNTDRRLVRFEDGQLSTLATFGESDAVMIPPGGTFQELLWAGLGAVAIDDTGRLMINASRQDDSQGLFFFDGSSWASTAIFGETSVGEGTIEWISGLRAAGNRFYGMFQVLGGGGILAEYDGTAWNPIVQSGDTLPNGAQIYWISSTFDANSNGDLVYSVNVGSGTTLVLRQGNGKQHTIYQSGDETDDGHRFWAWQDFDVDLRDDGSVYFMGIDFSDRKVIYHAQPLF